MVENYQRKDFNLKTLRIHFSPTAKTSSRRCYALNLKW